MIEIKQLTKTSFETIHEAFTNAFSDYVEPFDLSLEQLKYMFERRGGNLELSFGAFNGEQLVGLTLNGVGIWNGEQTVYDSGTGIIKEFRKQGIATKMFNESLPVLRENNITQYLLEVIKTNTAAVDLYRKAGFEVTREFDYYNTRKDSIKIKSVETEDGYEIRKINHPNWELVKTFWNFPPSWQNSIDSISRKIDNFKIVGVFDNNWLAGYGIIEPTTGDIPQFAISKKHRRKGLATELFKRLIHFSETETIKIINTEVEYRPFKQFAQSINLPAGIGQYEMLLKL
jgi:ribosomal protein S18 acetylase RimI-like enzyme